MRLDLHLHSTASDGSVSPTAVAEAAAAGGLDVIALTDHDTVAGVEAARAAGRVRSVEVISGVEVSSTWEGEEVHILGYFVDVGHPAMVEHGGRAGRLREETRGGGAEPDAPSPFQVTRFSEDNQIGAFGRGEEFLEHRAAPNEKRPVDSGAQCRFRKRLSRLFRGLLEARLHHE